MHSQYADQCHHNRYNQGQNSCGSYGFPHSFHISRPKALGGKDGKSSAHSHQKPDNQKADGPGGPYTCQCIGSHKLSNHNSIHHTVKLLKYISHKNRESKVQKNPARIP